MNHNIRPTFRKAQGWLVIIIVSLIPMALCLATVDLSVRFIDPAATL